MRVVAAVVEQDPGSTANRRDVSTAAVVLVVQDVELLPALNEQRDRSRGRADDDLALAHDDLRDRVQRNRFRQPGAQRIQAVRARRQGAVFRLTLPQCLLGLLPLSQIGAGSHAKRLAFSACCFGSIESPRAQERLGDLTGRAQDEAALAGIKRSRRLETEDDDADRPAGHEQRQDRCGLVRRKQMVGCEIREPGVAVRPRFDDDELLASHGPSDQASRRRRVLR